MNWIDACVRAIICPLETLLHTMPAWLCLLLDCTTAASLWRLYYSFAAAHTCAWTPPSRRRATTRSCCWACGDGRGCRWVAGGPLIQLSMNTTLSPLSWRACMLIKMPCMCAFQFLQYVCFFVNFFWMNRDSIWRLMIRNQVQNYIHFVENEYKRIDFEFALF